MARRYRSQDERVLQHILDHSDPALPFVSRTRARYGLLSLSATEFDEVLKRHRVETYFHEETKGQQYKLSEIAKALEILRDIYNRVESGVIFESSPETEESQGSEKIP